MKNYPQTIIFDFDYTLADSSSGVIECVNFALAKLGLPIASDDAIRRGIGLSLEETLVMLAGERNRGSHEEFLRLFVERADEVMVDATILFESVPGVIQSLKAQGIGLGIVSQKYRRRIETILERESLLDCFDVIVGGEDMDAFKPDPSGLLTALDRLGGSPTNSLYVGDSVTDAETAKRADVPFAAVLSGVTPKESFNGYPTFGIIESISELPGLISG
ncbi:MAG: HAD-IA family hydrolase [Chloroflexi bacterium]|nr:HAD-IA family hydrolase [Chloroflexota bacterium]